MQPKPECGKSYRINDEVVRENRDYYSWKEIYKTKTKRAACVNPNSFKPATEKNIFRQSEKTKHKMGIGWQWGIASNFTRSEWNSGCIFKVLIY